MTDTHDKNYELQVVILLMDAVTAWWGLSAVLATSALVGLTDVDALTLSLARHSCLPVQHHPSTLGILIQRHTRTLTHSIQPRLKHAHRCPTARLPGAAAIVPVPQ